MAFCPNCGTQAAGTFCPNCGTPVATSGSGPAAAAAPAPEAPPQYQAQAQPLAAPGMSDNVAGALAYLAGFITGIIFLVLAPYNQSKFVRFHAFQAIFLHVGFIVLSIGVSILGALTHGLALLLWPLMGLAGFALWVYMMYSAFNNHKVKLPFIGDLAEKQA